MKKLITVLSIIALAACALSLVGCKDNKIRKDWSLTSYVDEEGFLGVEGYEIKNCTAYTEKKLVVPGEYEGQPIVNVTGSFPYVYSKSITFSEGIRSISDVKFKENVTNISLPNSLLYFPAYLIENLPNLTYNVKNGVKYLGNKKNPYVYAVGLADETVTDVVLEEGCTAIGSFSGTNIETFTFSSGVEIIPADCFVGCSSLTTVTFGDKTRWVKTAAFASCFSLTTINDLSQIKYIGMAAFCDCTSLTSIALDSAQTILDSAFSGCTSLTEVEIPHTVTEYGGYVFDCCTSLKTVRFNATVSVLPEDFYEVQLKELVVGNAVLSFGKDVLKYSAATLETIKLSDAMTTLPAYFFSGFSSLKEVNLPASLTKIPQGCFMNCSSLTDITLPAQVEEIESEAFWGCTSLTSIKIPSRVTQIAPRTFYDCCSLSSVTFTKNVKAIGEQAFYGCTAFRSIVLPDNVTSIGAEAFGSCINLTKIVLPSSVVDLSYRVFIGCPDLTVYCKGGEEGPSWHPDWNTEGVPVEFNYRSN